MTQLEKQIIELDIENDCQKILQEVNVKVGDILQIYPQQKYESDGLVDSVNWNENGIIYLIREGLDSENIREIRMEFDTFGCPMQYYTNLFIEGTKEYNKRNLKLIKAGIRRWKI